MLTTMLAALSLQKTIVCEDIEIALATLTEKYQEQIVWIGRPNARTASALYANADTGTWTFVQFDEEWMCVLSAGRDSQLHEDKSSPTRRFMSFD